MEKWERTRVDGPLGVFRDGFGQWLVERGYSPLSIRNLVLVMANLAKWMSGAGLGVGELTSSEVERYAAYRRAAGYTAWRTPGSLALLVGYLRQVGMPPPDPALVLVVTEADALVRGFGDWLATERHLAPPSVKAHVVWAKQFVGHVLRGPDGEVVGRVAADDVEAFIAFAASKWAVTSMGGPTAALRYFLRYLSRLGLCEPSLVDAVPKTRRYLRLGLPTAHTPEAVAAVLGVGDDGGRTGLRDAAIAALVTDLGLRGTEVARLTLDDIDWAHAVVTVSGKNGLREQMPLTGRAGGLVARWLSGGRQALATRHVFHTVVAPLRPMTGLAVKDAVVAAGRRAGVDGFTTRTARHCLGCAAIAGGGALEDARQLLRHESAASTAIYARVDTTALAELAVPWPGAAS